MHLLRNGTKRNLSVCTKDCYVDSLQKLFLELQFSITSLDFEL